MPLEVGNVIADLDESYPLGGDPVNKGDDHVRLVKHVMKTTFPGAGGAGFAKQILATEDEINYLSGVVSPIQDQVNGLNSRISQNESDIAALSGTIPAPVGTRIPFYQAAAPNGWVQVTTADVNDAMLRVVSGAGGGSGGLSSPIALSHIHTTAGHALTELEMPPHEHDYTTGRNTATTGIGHSSLGGGRDRDSDINRPTESAGGGAPHAHGDTGEATITPKYVDMIICEKS